MIKIRYNTYMTITNEMQIQRKERYRKRKRQGMQDLRVMCLLFFVGLILYTCANGYVVFRIQDSTYELIKWYGIYAVGTMLGWCIPIYLLWHFNRLGRLLFLSFVAGSLYLYRNSMQFLSIDIEKDIWFYAFIVLFVIKCLLILWVVMRLMFASSIHCIWSMDEMYDEELEMEPEDDEEEAEEISVPVQKAQKKLKRGAIWLAILLYLSLLIIFMMLSLLKKFVPVYETALSDVQMILFTQCLFSTLVWSIPMMVMYMGKRKSSYILYLAILVEILYACFRMRDYQVIFQNKDMPLQLQALYIAITSVRYLLLLKFTQGISANRLLKAYRKGKIS